MRILPFDATVARAIETYGARGASSVPLGSGTGPAHVYVVRFEAGGDIGAHDTGFGQLFIVVDGAGWVSGADDVRVSIVAGHAAYFHRGTRHTKGSDTGMTAVMVQVHDLEPHDLDAEAG